MIRHTLLAAAALLATACGDGPSKTAAPDDTAYGPVPFGDPFILCHEGRYYAYGTRSSTGIQVFTSDDLHHWRTPDGKPEGYKALDIADSYGTDKFFAPEVYCIDGRFYMYYSASEHICVATADSPLGPFRQDEKKPMTQRKGIDNSLFIDDDGTPYLCWVHFNNGNEVWLGQLEKDLKTIKPGTAHHCFGATQAWELAEEFRINEGPFLVKHNGIYYMTYSGNHFRSPDYGIGYATATDPMGEWAKYEGNPLMQYPGTLQGTGHHAFFTDAEGRHRIVFHSHHDSTHIGPRPMHISTYRFVPQTEGPDVLEISPDYFTPVLVTD